jgi:hypothetical protein
MPTLSVCRIALAWLVLAGACKDSNGPAPDTDYNIVIRFFGSAMSPSNQALFTNAAARIGTIVQGDIINAVADTLDLEAACEVSGQPRLSETIDDVIIYASIQAVDGPGQVLAQAGPCLVRETSTGVMTAIGVMLFDSADLGTLSNAGRLQDVVTHEMLHVLGVGTLWEDRGTLTGATTIDPRYTGAFGREGCLAVGGTVTCATDVPVENTGGDGTADAHWRETTFDTEMMTGFIDGGALPISALTVGSLRDLGFQVNAAAADSYTIPGGQIRVGTSDGPASHPGWERVVRPYGMLESRGRVRKLRQQ